ncbi:unnamed protein product, partial [Staurois parvus]
MISVAPEVPPISASAHQCHINATYQCTSMPHISANLSCLSMSPISVSQCLPLSVAYQCIYQCHVSVSAAFQCPSVM